MWAIAELAFVGNREREVITSYGEEEVSSVVSPFADTIRWRLKELSSLYFLKLVCVRQDGRILVVHIFGEVPLS